MHFKHRHHHWIPILLLIPNRLFRWCGVELATAATVAGLDAQRHEAEANLVKIDATGHISQNSEETPDIANPFSKHSNDTTIKGLECGLWLAPSAIEGAGLGMYAGRHFEEGERLEEVGDLCIPIIDINLHNAADGRDFGDFLWDQYTWSGAGLDAGEECMVEANVASPGFGSAANSFLPLVNVDEYYPHRDYVGLHRSKDPGAGAFSAYYDRPSKATRDISAGEELYVSYGEEWFKGRPHLGSVPLTDDLNKATKLFQQYAALKRRLGQELGDSAFVQLWDDFILNNPWNTSSRTLGSFKDTDREDLLKTEKFPSLADIRTKQATRSPEWLEQHGTCADHIRGGPSTISQAGHGGFASRNIPKGTIVAQLPLIHILNRNRLNMYKLDTTTGENIPAKDAGQRPPQIMLNYCYGHAESTLLLCPYGPSVNLVNHNQTLANVRLQWADPKRGNHMPEVLEEELGYLHRDKTAKIAFEFVATRDIAKDEEIFLDYGSEWENAWQNHVEMWEPVEDADEYKNADEMNKLLKQQRGRLDFPTEFERMEHDIPHPPGVLLGCNNYFSDELWRDEYENGKLLQGLEDWEDSVDYLYCTILRKEIDARSGETLYTVEAIADDDEESFIWESAPDAIFHYLDKPYGTDMFLENAFRHDIRIPDEIFPLAWRNLIDEDDEEEDDDDDDD